MEQNHDKPTALNKVSVLRRLVASRRPDGVKKRDVASELRRKKVGSHRPDGVTFIVIVTSDVRRS